MAGRGIVIKIEGDGESAKRALEMVREQLRETSESAKHEGSEIGEAMERVKRSLEYIGIYAGIREAIDGLKEMVGGSVELGVELGHLSQQTGISTENLSVMKYMADKTGVGFETLTKSFRKFSVEILGAEEGKKQSIATFQRLGITQKEVKEHGNDMLDMLGLVADRFKTMPAGPLKAAEAVGLFGKAGMSMIPILNEGSEGIASYAAEAKSLGLVLTEEGVAKMEALHAATVKLHGAMEGAGLGITTGMTPALEGMIDALANATGKGQGWVDIGHKMGNATLGAANVLAYLVMTIRQAAAEWDMLQSHIDHPADVLDATVGFTKGQRDRGAARAAEDERMSKQAVVDYKKARDDYEKFANELAQSLYDPATSKPHLSFKQEGGPDGLGLGDQSGKNKKPKSDDPIVRAAAELAVEQTKAAADARKTSDELNLTELETQHKLLLVTDQEYFAEKLRLQNDALDAEAESLKAKGETLQALYDKQRADKLLKRGKDGSSAEELRTQKELLQVQEQMLALTLKRGKDSSSNTTESTASERAAEIASLKVMAELEKQRNEGITAQIALVRREHDEEARKSTAAGGSVADAAAIKAAGELEVTKLRIKEVTDQIRDSEAENTRAVKELADAAEKDPRFKKAATAQINALNQAEAEQLRVLVAQYDALAQELGGPFLETAKNLHAEIDKLSRPDNKSDAAFAKTLASGVESMADKIVESAARGKASFSSMVQSMGDDILRLALKLAEEKWLTPFLMGLGGGGGSVPGVPDSMYDALGSSVPHFADGGMASGLALVGEKGPELVNFGTPGMVHSNALSTKIADAASGGGNGKGVSIVSNVINSSSQPVTAQPSQVSYDSEMKQFILHTVLTDMNQGGPLAQANQK
jgi:hypothetical protein